jgi:DNA-binding transcriptional MerR regulator
MAMEYKISELVKQTGVAKSTILYYIKEGLLPEANKVKPNVHYYNDQHLELIKYIKYMQNEMNCSIAQIKQILEHQNRSFSSSVSMLIPLVESLTGIGAEGETFSREAVIGQTGIDEALLQQLLDDELLLPAHEGEFLERDLAIVKLVQNYRKMGLDTSILYAYLKSARELAGLECALQQSLCSSRDEANFSNLWHILFETVFTAKPYIHNNHTYREFLKILKEEVKSQK